MSEQSGHAGDAVVVRWLAISGAAGAAAAAAIGHFSHEGIWQTVAMIAALLAVAGVAGLWRAFHKKERVVEELAIEVVQQTSEQTREVSALHEELEAHRRMERELTEAKQTAEAAMMAKGEFLATMSHEIRTPLNGIIPMLDLLMGSKLAADQHELLRTAFTSARQMQRIVDDILDYSKLEANKLQLESTSFNLRDLLNSVVHLMEKPAEAKGLRLSLHIDPSVRLAMRGDPIRLRQVLTNLVSNAVKFTERGSVTVSVTRRGETRSHHELRFEVRDSGIGIAKDKTSRLFRAFSQADASTTRLYGGTGLGLAICKRIIDLMGGTIGVESDLGRGALFWFDIPLLKAAGDMQEQRSDLNGSRVLLLSNDAVLRQKLSQNSSSWGLHLTLTETTQDALDRLRNSLSRGPTWAFDLLMVDLHSARSTAIALVRNLRRMPELEGLRVVYLHGDDPPSHELMSGGNTAMALSRTIGASELRSALANFLLTPCQRPEPTASAPPMAEQPLAGATPAETTAAAPARLQGHLLLVEDNPVNLMVAQRLIGLLGMHCETADNGEKALQRLLMGGIDLVLMDCQMPVKDGYTATREWRQHEENQHLPRLPIIAMTANAMAGDRQKCLDAGMDDYLSKPVDRRLLEAMIRRFLAMRPATPATAASQPAAPPSAAAMPAPTPAPAPPVAAPVMPAAPAAATPPPASTGTAAPANEPRGPVLQMDVVEELRAVMGGEFQSLVQVFLEDAPHHVDQLELASASNDLAAMVAPAHTLKSAAANLGAMTLSAAAKRIEMGARQGELARPAVAVAVLEAEFRRARQALGELLGHGR